MLGYYQLNVKCPKFQEISRLLHLVDRYQSLAFNLKTSFRIFINISF